jgi:hypothetical protein
MKCSIQRTVLLMNIGIVLAAGIAAFAQDGSSAATDADHHKAYSAYVATSSNDFGKLDLVTGKYQHISVMNSLPTPLGGLGRVHGKLYGGAVRTGNLYQIDRHTGSATLVGESDITYWLTGSTLGVLYAVSTDMNLYRIDPETAAATLIGATGINPENAGGGALSSGSNKLYMSEGNNYAATLYQLDTTTGAATAIGLIASNTGAPPMVFEGSVLFAGVNFPSQRVCRLDTQTGSPTCFANVSGLPGYIDGLAPTHGMRRDLGH